MVELLGLVASFVVLLLVLLPLLTFVRLARVSRDLEALSERVRQLESAPRPSHPVSDAPRSSHPVDAPGESHPVVAPSGSAPVDLESRIGGRGLLYAGVLVLLFGVSFFLKYAFENAWINETGRVVAGALSALGLIAGGLRLERRDLRAFGQALIGTGLAVLYLVCFAALNFYQLIGPITAFVLMVGVTATAALLADRLRSHSLALIAVGGGFLTPLLIGDESSQTILFSYVALLIFGALLLALRHNWRALNVASYLLTLITLGAWGARHYTDAQWLRTLLFLTLFCVLFLIILRNTARASNTATRVLRGVLLTAPALYHVVALALTSDHPPAIHVYLIAFTAAGLWLTAEPNRPWMRLIVLLAAMAPLLGTAALPAGRSWIVPNLVTIVTVAGLHVMAIADRIVRQNAALRAPELLSLHLTGLGLFALVYQATHPLYPELRGAVALVIAAAYLGLWRWWRARDRDASLHAAALALTLVAIATAVQFDGPFVVVGWAAEGAVIVWLGLRSANAAFQFGGLVLWSFAALRLLETAFETPAAFTPIVNTRALTTAFVIGVAYAVAWLFNHSNAPSAGRARAALHTAASILTVVWITAEITSYWEVRYESSQAYLYEQMLLSLAWSVYGALLIAVGMRRRYAPVRYIGMTLLTMTVAKVFLYDIWQLGGIYRVIGFLGSGALLLLVSYLYQRRRG